MDLKGNVAATGHRSYYSTGALDDRQGHGSHVSGTIAGMGDNAYGVVGICWKAKLLAVKVLGDNGSGSDANVVDGIHYAINSGAKVLNMSLGGASENNPYPDLARFLDSSNALVAAAAGNDGMNIDSKPFAYASVESKHIIGVAAIGEDLKRASFSNYGPGDVDIAAPGVRILSTLPGGKFAEYNGTSMATPHIAGALTLMWSQNPTMTADEIKQLLFDSASTLTSLGGLVAGSRTLDINSYLKKSPPTLQVSELQSFFDGATLLTDLQYALKDKIDAAARMGNTVASVKILSETDEVLAEGTADEILKLLIKNSELPGIKIVLEDSAGNIVTSEPIGIKAVSQKQRDGAFLTAVADTGAVECKIMVAGAAYHSVSLNSLAECQKYCSIHGPLVLGSLKSGTCQSGSKVFYNNSTP
jgi:subtilisin family serine protease